MAQIVLNIPDPQVNRVLDALAKAWGYDAELHGSDRVAFIKSQIIMHIRRSVLKGERQSAADAVADNDPGIS